MDWIINTENNKDIDELRLLLNADKTLLKILFNRGFTKEKIIKLFKTPNDYIIPPEKLKNANEVAERIKFHIKNNSHIYIFADYDADGLNSGYIMHNVIKNIIGKERSKSIVESYYPNRSEGFGLSIDFCNKIIKNKDNKDILVITVDNGISKIDEVNLLKNNNIDVIITDHHESLEEVPDCLICDPHNYFIEQDDTFKHLCGTGVVFKICELLQKKFNFYNMYKYTVNLAIATIADVMPLSDENIVMILYGIYIMNSKDCPLWIEELKKYLSIKTINPINIGWDIAPRLNAGGRMDKIKLCYGLLFEEERDNIKDILCEIEKLNDIKKYIVKEKVKEINDTTSFFIIKIYDDIPIGLAGIIASKIVETYNKPAIVGIIDNGICKCSVRSVPGIDILEFFKYELSINNIISYGGHKEACGLAFEYNKLDSLLYSLNLNIEKIINKTLEKERISIDDISQEERFLIDDEKELKELNEDTYNTIYEIPYNSKEISKPIFLFKDCKVISALETKNNKDNLWLTIKQDNNKDKLKIWYQNGSQKYKSIKCPKTIDIIGYIEKDFINKNKYTLKIIDIK